MTADPADSTSDDPTADDTPSDPAPLALRPEGVALPGPCQDGRAPTAVDSQGRLYELTQGAVVVTTRRGSRRIPLDAPGDVRFASLPRVDLDDGRPLRRAAFDAWAAQLRGRLAAGAAWETTYRPRKPYHTAFAMAGGVLLGGSALWAVATWASSQPQVTREPGVVEAIVLAAGVGMLLWVAYATLTSVARYWLSRNGSFVRVDVEGVTVVRGGRGRPASEIVAAIHHPFLRAAELRLADGRVLWVPRENGPLVRLDLVLAALPGGPPAAL